MDHLTRLLSLERVERDASFHRAEDGPARGTLHTSSGTLVASVGQEVLLRVAKS